MHSVKLALDWSPNTLHAGFFYALLKGWYLDAGIQLDLINPEENDYVLTPAKQVANGTAHFGIAPTESVLSYQTLSTPIPLVAVATLLQEDTSAIVTLAESNLTEPKHLDGKLYASYGARYEDYIVKKLIQNDGGFGMLRIANPAKLGIWDTLLKNKADATWVFMPWEGVIAKQNEIELNAFQLKDFGIPYGYSPLLVTHGDVLENYPDVCKSFLSITAKAFEYVAGNSDEAAAFLCDEMKHPNFDNPDLIQTSLAMLQDKWMLNKTWGTMEDHVWSDFIQWLSENNVLCNLDGESLSELNLNITSLYTNQYLP